MTPELKNFDDELYLARFHAEGGGNARGRLAAPVEAKDLAAAVEIEAFGLSEPVGVVLAAGVGSIETSPYCDENLS